jgi:hypothetical protein
MIVWYEVTLAYLCKSEQSPILSPDLGYRLRLKKILAVGSGMYAVSTV